MSITVHTPGIRAVLRAADVPRTLAASVIGRLPLGSAPLALLLAARETTSIPWAGALVGAYTAGAAVGQPMFARLADRWRQPPALWLAVAVSTAGFAALAAGLPLAAALVASAAAGLGTPPFEPCLRALWRDVLDKPLIPAAYTLDITVQEVIFIVGPLVTTASTALGGPRAGLLAAAVTQLLGALLYTTVPAVRRWRGVAAVRHGAGPFRSRQLIRLLITTMLIGAGVGATTVAITAYAETTGRPAWSGWLLAAQAAGALAGGLLLAGRAAARPRRTLAPAIAALSAGYLPLLLVTTPLLKTAAMAVSGVFLPVVLASAFMLVDEVAPPGTAAESFAWVATAFAAGSAAGAAVDGLLVEGLGTRGGFLLAPPAILAGALLALAWRRRPPG